MTKDSVKKYTLYRLRFWIGYGFLAILMLGILVFAMLYVPGGLTKPEQQSALTSAAINPSQLDSFLIIDLPYHLLQKASITLLGLSSLSVKLPSVIIGFITAIGLVLLLRRWFSAGVSVITAGLTLVTAQFILISQSGTPDIMQLFWPIVALLCATYAVRRGKLSQVAAALFGLIAALSLFTPFSAYMLAAFLVSGLLHPHVRFLFHKMSKPVVSLCILLGILVVLPLIYMIYKDLSTVSQLLYAAQGFSTDILANAKLIVLRFFDFTTTSSDNTGILTPFYGISTLALLVVGLIALFRHKHTAHSYLLVIWFVLMVPLILFNPQSLKLLFVPFALLIGGGVAYTLGYWYKLFPTNPYARAFALLPIGILLISIIFSGGFRYFYTFHYDSTFATKSSHDLDLVGVQVAQTPNGLLLVSSSEAPLYKLYYATHKLDEKKIYTDISELTLLQTTGAQVTATRESSLVKTGRVPTYIVASPMATTPSDRLYIYKSLQK